MNGILAKIPGDFVARGSRLLPSPETAEKREHAVELVAGHVGRVTIWYEPMIARKAKHRHAFWSACRAERVAD